MITVTIRHNLASDAQGRHTAMLDGYQPGNPMVRVFAYHADPAGRSPETIAEEALAICTGHPRDAHGTDLARRYYERELRSLCFPGSSLCCRRSCCIHRSVLWRRIAITDRSPADSTMMRQAARHLNSQGFSRSG